MRISVVCIAASLLGCGLTNYEKAATQFGVATSAAVVATRSVVGTAHEMCLIRASFHAVEARFEAPDFRRGTEPLSLPSGVPTGNGKGTLTWGEYCDELVDYDKAIVGALSALDAYASALRSAATGDGVAIQTDLTSALASDASALAEEIGTSAFAKAKDLSGPVTELANVVLDLLRTKKIKDAVRKGKGPVSTVLEGMNEYLGAAKLQLSDAERIRKQLVRNADAVIPVRGEGQALPRDLPGQALALYEFERLERARLQTIADQLSSTSTLVQDLKEAHAELAKGAEAGATDQGVRDFVAKKAQEIVKQINALRKLNGKG